ncbi:MAG TPA: hypothetical protein VFD30_13425 [Terriglobia bacterium]|jgi:hypothetical protein|nr:hypothetical protein [Terriglobia bacterium]
MAALILILSTALFFFYFQVTCQRILRRQFEQEYFQSIVNANRLEFPSVQKALEEFDAPVDYARLRTVLKCDFLALTYLLKNAANVNQKYSNEDRLLILYFRAVFFWMGLRHLFRLNRERISVLRLTQILKYFANVVGQRVNMVRFGNLTATDYLLNL